LSMMTMCLRTLIEITSMTPTPTLTAKVNNLKKSHLRNRNKLSRQSKWKRRKH
jgi:hypothetical protein